MWCDSFDADLLAIVPGAAEAIGDAAGIALETYSRPYGGKINCPSAWNSHSGMEAFFWTHPGGMPPAGYLTHDPVTPCTFLEVARDEWVHGALVIVDHHQVWRPPERLMDALMFDLRGWTPLPDGKREGIRQSVRDSLAAAAARLLEVCAAAEASGA